MSGWYETLESRAAYEGVLSRVRVDTVSMPDGGTAQREVVEHPDAVALVPLLDDGSVVMLRQYRHPFGDYQLEIPAGKIDVDGEGPEATARRELREETGLTADRLTLLTTFRNSSGWTDESTHVFLAEDLRDEGRPEDFEAQHEEAEMKLVRLALEEAVAQVRNGTISDAKSAIGLLLAADRPSRGAGEAPTRLG